MKNKAIWAGLASFLLLMGANAAPVSLETAKKTAEKFYGVQLQQAAVKSLPALSCVYPKSTKGSDFVPYYIFNAEKEQGFVIVAGDDNAASLILGYSDKGSFQTENMPDNLKFWLSFYEEGVRNAAAYNGISRPQPKSDFTKAEVVKGPLLDSIQYNQDAPYNDLCPIDHTTGKRSVTGCVATALTSIARYYEYPKQGQDSISYTTSKGLKLSMNFANNTYDWENMLKSYNGKLSQYTEEQRNAVATLMRDMGYAVQMGYGSDASGAMREPTTIGVVQYMGFDSILNYRERTDYDNDDQWIAVLKDNLDNDLPVYYTGQGDGGGHAFICDGYNENDFFHINWGWGGLSNGYFSVRNMNPGDITGIGAGTGGGYSQMQAILHNMVPPGHKRCEDLFLITARGAIEANLPEDSVYSIKNSPFEVTYSGFENHAMSVFKGAVALAVFQGGELLNIISGEENVEIAKRGTEVKICTLQADLKGLEDGDYEIWTVCKPDMENAKWQKVYANLPNRYTTDSYIPVRIRNNTYELLKTTAVVNITLHCTDERYIPMFIHSSLGELLGSEQLFPESPKNFTFRHGSYQLRFWTIGFDTSYVDLKITGDTAIEVDMQEIYPEPYIFGVRVRGTTATMLWMKEPPQGEKAFPEGFIVYLDSVEVAKLPVSVTEYDYLNVKPGYHWAGVRSVYTTGQSAMVNSRFQVKETANETPWNGVCRISPNPSADGYFTLEVDRDCRLQVASVSGNILFERELAPGSHPVDMSAYQAGVYLFRLSGKNGESTVLKAVIR